MRQQQLDNKVRKLTMLRANSTLPGIPVYPLSQGTRWFKTLLLKDQPTRIEGSFIAKARIYIQSSDKLMPRKYMHLIKFYILTPSSYRRMVIMNERILTVYGWNGWRSNNRMAKHRQLCVSY